MRRGVYLPQQAIVAHRLLGAVSVDAWLLLDYLRRWESCEKLKTIKRGDMTYFWIDYEHACDELPLLFPHEPSLRTKLNKMVRLVAELKRAALLKTERCGRRCFVCVTESARALYRTPRDLSAADGISVTENRVNAGTRLHDDTVTQCRDDAPPTLYKEEHYKDKLTPIVPTGDGDDVGFTFWTRLSFQVLDLEPFPLPARLQRTLRQHLPHLDQAHAPLLIRLYDPGFEKRSYPYSIRKRTISTLIRHLPQMTRLAAAHCKAAEPSREPQDWARRVLRVYPSANLRSFGGLPSHVWEEVLRAEANGDFGSTRAPDSGDWAKLRQELAR